MTLDEAALQRKKGVENFGYEVESVTDDDDEDEDELLNEDSALSKSKYQITLCDAVLTF